MGGRPAVEMGPALPLEEISRRRGRLEVVDAVMASIQQAQEETIKGGRVRISIREMRKRRKRS